MPDRRASAEFAESGGEVLGDDRVEILLARDLCGGDEPRHAGRAPRRDDLDVEYDIIAALNEPRGTDVIGTLVTKSLLGEGGGRVGFGSAYGVVMLVLCLGFIIWYVTNHYRESDL